MTLRLFHAADLEPLLALIVRTMARSYAGAYSPAALERFRRFHSRSSLVTDAIRGETVVADGDGRPVATGTLVGSYVKRVFVDPDLHRQGWGRRVMQYLETRALEWGVQRLRLDASLPSRAFYEALGYRLDCETYLPLDGGDRLVYFEMSKDLLPRARRRFHDRLFVVEPGPHSGPLPAGTLLHLRQTGSSVNGLYKAGGERLGVLLGRVDAEGNLDVRMQHLGLSQDIVALTGWIEAQPESGLLSLQVHGAGHSGMLPLREIHTEKG